MVNKILAAISVIATFLALWFRGSRAQERADKAEAVTDIKDKATEAVVKGVAREADDSDTDTYDFNK